MHYTYWISKRNVLIFIYRKFQLSFINYPFLSVVIPCHFMMTSSNRNIFRVTGPLWGDSTGHRWIPLSKASDPELWCFITNGWANNTDTGDLWRHRAHYDVIVMLCLDLLYFEQAEHRPSTKRGMFVNIMRRRGQRGFERFIEALMRTGQIEIAHALDKRLADSWWVGWMVGWGSSWVPTLC